MKFQTLICAAMLGTVGFSSAAVAQGYERRDGERVAQRDDRRGDDRRGDDRRGEDRRGDMRRPGDRGPDERRREMDNRRGAMDNRERDRDYNAQRWHKGDRLPAEYRQRHYVVDNWREHRLQAPPRGYQWVQVGPDFVLVAVATGVIAQLLMGR